MASQVTLVQREVPISDCDKVLKTARAIQKTDRANLEKAQRAFVSFVQAYKKHECNIILRLKGSFYSWDRFLLFIEFGNTLFCLLLFIDLDLASLATGFGLLQLPKMPELKNADTSGFVPEVVDLNNISFKNNERETSRQKKLATFKETGVWPSKKNQNRPKKQSEPWSIAKANKEERKEKKRLRKEKKAELKAQGIETKKRKKGVTDEEYQELANDIALMKKLKKKKVCE